VEIKKSSKMAAITMKPKPITLEMAHLLLGHISDDHIVKSLAMIDGLIVTGKDRAKCTVS
jgi:hypothetical protein